MRFLLITFLLLTITFSLKAQNSVSLDDKIGQMLMIGYSGTSVTANDKILKDFAQGKAGGVIFFEKNLAKENTLLTMKNMIWTMQNHAKTPLLVAIDQEGGRVNRLKAKYGFPDSKSAKYLGQFDPDSTRYYAELTAGTLAMMGFNVNFAPVVDLASNPDNPVINGAERAYSADPKVVATHAEEVIKAHNKNHIATALKHFPGHGSSMDDTHFGMADVTDLWNENELEPYKILIEKGLVNGVMSSHIVHRGLDQEGYPGTLSKKIITDVLRNKLNYQGVVYTDDMQMQAITKHYGLEQAVFRAIDAGVDMMIFSNNIQGSENRTLDTVHELIKKMISEGRISEERIDQSYQRIMTLKADLGL